MLLGAVLLHRRLQLFESRGHVLGVHLCAQRGDLVLEVMGEPSDRLDVLLGLQILLMLAFELRVDRGQLHIRGETARLLLLRIQDHEPA